MARRRGTKKREVLPDPIYRDTLVTKFINSLMYSGKKSVAEGIFYKTLNLIKERGSENEGNHIGSRTGDQITPFDG